MVPVPPPLVKVRSVVSLLIQVTEVVMSCCVLLLGKVAKALKVTDDAGAGLVGDAVSVISVGTPSLTVVVAVAGVALPKAALICVVQTPVTVVRGVIKPVLLMVAQVGVAELQIAFPVRFLVDPSL